MKRWGIGLFVVAMAALAAVVWSTRPRSIVFFTDADTIRESADRARLRDILWQPPTRLAPGLNTDADDYEPRVAGDGQTLFFVRGRAGENADIYTSRKTRDGWSDPEPLPGVNSQHDELGPTLTPEGETLFFYSNRPGGLGGYDLWSARRGPEGWTANVTIAPLGPNVNSSYNDYGPALSPDGTTLYFASNRPRPSEEARHPSAEAWPATIREDLERRDYDLFTAAIDADRVGRAAPLLALNTSHSEGAPGVSPVGDFLYFASDRPGGEGGFDLYRSRRLKGGHEPTENLGPTINTPANELDPGLATDGFTLLFSSDRLADASAAPEVADYDLYSTSSREVFREQEPARSDIDWAGLWSAIGPNLLWALLALFLLLLLLLLMRDTTARKLSLLTKCLLASLMAHLLLLFLLNFWEVTVSLAEALRRRPGLRVALVARARGESLAMQIRGNLTDVAPPPRETMDVARMDTQVEAPPTLAPTVVTVERLSEPVAEPLPFEAESADTAPPPMSVPPPIEPQESTDASNSVELGMPDAPTRRRQNEIEAQVDPSEPRLPLHDRPDVAEAVPSDEDQLAEMSPSEVQQSAPTESLADNAYATDAPADADQPLEFADASVAIEPPSTPTVSTPAEGRKQSQSEVEQPQPPTETRIDAPRFESAAARAIDGSRSALTTQPVITPPDAPTPAESLVEVNAVDDAAMIPRPAVERTDATVVLDTMPRPDVALPMDRAGASERAEADAPPPVASTLASTRNDAVPGFGLPAFRELAAPVQTAMHREAQLIPLAGIADPAEAMPSAPNPEPHDLDPHRLASESLAPIELGTLEETVLRGDQTTDLEAPQAESTASPRADVQSVGGDSTHRSPQPLALTTPGVPLSTPPMDASLAAGLGERANNDPARSTFAAPPAPPAPAALPLSDGLAIAVAIPTEQLPVEDPYAQRSPEKRALVLERMGGSEDTQRAVDRALHWLVQHQSPDGRWNGKRFHRICGRCDGRARADVDVALTGLSVLALLGADHTPRKDGPYRENVEKGIDWLLEQQRDNGDLRGPESMYSHGIATIAIAEAYGMTRDPALADPVRRACEFIVRAKSPRGGWRYDPGQRGDTSVLGWQVMALKSAELAGIEIPNETYEAAEDWLAGVRHPDEPGRYGYQPGRQFTDAMTAEAMFTYQLLGRDGSDPAMQASAAFLARRLPRWRSHVNTYYWYYATLALFHHQGDEWSRWNERLTAELLERQEDDGHESGSWSPDGEWARTGGRIYQTAICTLMLEVYYRYLPLYSTARLAERSNPAGTRDDAAGR